MATHFPNSSLHELTVVTKGHEAPTGGKAASTESTTLMNPQMKGETIKMTVFSHARSEHSYYSRVEALKERLAGGEGSTSAAENPAVKNVGDDYDLDFISPDQIPRLDPLPTKEVLLQQLRVLQADSENVRPAKEFGIIQGLPEWKLALSNLKTRMLNQIGLRLPAQGSSTRERMDYYNKRNMIMPKYPQVKRNIERLEHIEEMFTIDADRQNELASNKELFEGIMKERDLELAMVRGEYSRIHSPPFGGMMGPMKPPDVDWPRLYLLADMNQRVNERFIFPAGDDKRREAAQISTKLFPLIGRHRIKIYELLGAKAPDILDDPRTQDEFEQATTRYQKLLREFRKGPKTFEAFAAMKEAEHIQESNYFFRGKKVLEQNAYEVGRLAILLNPNSLTYKEQLAQVERVMPAVSDETEMHNITSYLCATEGEQLKPEKAKAAGAQLGMSRGAKKRLKKDKAANRAVKKTEVPESSKPVEGSKSPDLELDPFDAEMEAAIEKAKAAGQVGVRFEGIAVEKINSFLKHQLGSFAKLLGFQEIIRRPNGSIKTDIDFRYNNMLFEVSFYAPIHSWDHPDALEEIERKRKQIKERLFNIDGVNKNKDPVTFWSLTFPQKIVDEFMEMAKKPNAAPFYFARTMRDIKEIMLKPEVEVRAFARVAEEVGFVKKLEETRGAG